MLVSVQVVDANMSSIVLNHLVWADDSRQLPSFGIVVDVPSEVVMVLTVPHLTAVEYELH